MLLEKRAHRIAWTIKKKIKIVAVPNLKKKKTHQLVSRRPFRVYLVWSHGQREVFRRVKTLEKAKKIIEKRNQEIIRMAFYYDEFGTEINLLKSAA